ncbi:MAG: hypothetical protein HWD61_10280 [Parachlamydiaceae bacterium]|nr:MAG: hypothetical protein HWD61_10280 [Parachlamydiaceae bacterium]
MGQPLSSINEHVRTDLHSDYSTEDLKQQIENDPGFLSEIPQDHFLNY